MKTQKLSLLLLSCLFVVYSCDDNISEGIVVVDDANTTHVEQRDFDRMFESVTVIPLETTDECIISNIKKACEHDGCIYALAIPKAEQTVLYRFDAKGHFLNSIGKRGNARNEYSRINTFVVNGDGVYIVDSNKGNMMRYASDGTFIDVVAMGESLQFVEDAVLQDDGKTLLLSYGINFDDAHPLYRLMDLATGDILWELDTRYKANGSYPHTMRAMATYGKSTLLTQPIDKTIYKMDLEKHALDDLLDIRCHGKLATPITDEYLDAEREQERGSLICGMFCAGDILMVNFLTGYVAWDMREGRGMRLDNGVDYNDCETIPCIPLSIVYATDNCFVTSWSPSNLRECLEAIGNPDLIDADVLSSISSNSNPILVKHLLSAKPM